MESSDINCVLLGKTLLHRGLVILLARAEFLHYASLFILSLEFLEGSLNILALFNRYNDHVLIYLFYSLISEY